MNAPYDQIIYPLVQDHKFSNSSFKWVVFNMRSHYFPPPFPSFLATFVTASCAQNYNKTTDFNLGPPYGTNDQA